MMSVRTRLSTALHAKIEFEIGILPAAAISAAAAAMLGWYAGFGPWLTVANVFLWAGYGAIIGSSATEPDCKSSCNRCCPSLRAVIVLAIVGGTSALFGASWSSIGLAIMILGGCAGFVLAIRGHVILATEVVRIVTRTIGSFIFARRS